MAKDHSFRFVRTVGGLLPSEVLKRITALDAGLGGLSPDHYHLAGERIPEAISRSWGRMLAVWANFQSARSHLLEGEAATGVTRDKLLLPLFREFGYGQLSLARAQEVQGRTYPISHMWNGVPLHLVGVGVDLDRRTAGAAGAARQSPHGLMQEYLNRTEALWGVVSNGLRLRLLRDNATLTRQAYVEFDLEAIFEAEAYADFALLWLLVHESRLFTDGKELKECWLEHWQELSAEQGKRALNQLRDGVKTAINQLGSGFLAHPANSALKAALRQGELSPQDYYRQLLRLVYRLLFMFVAEDRDCLMEAPSEGLDPAQRERLERARKLYTDHYSTARLRSLAEGVKGTKHGDLYQLHRLVAGYLAKGGAAQLALKPLDSFLFNPEGTSYLNAELSNRDFLDAVRSLAFTQDGQTLRPVDYKNLGAEELGSVYEQLLELVAEVNIEAAYFELKNLAGNERKTSGSYYTPTPLIDVALDEALTPVLERAVKIAKQLPAELRDQPILSLKVVDPAVGSGHFLIAAAHRMARVLAQLRSGEDEPAPQELRSALRDVIRNCLYGVDINEMSAELCKVALWIEMAEPGKPLGFLDHHIKVGNSLLGAPPNFYSLGIPNEAYKREDVDASSVALSKSQSKKEQEAWRKKYGEMLDPITLTVPDLHTAEDSLQEVQDKARRYQEWRSSETVQKWEFAADYWTAAWLAKVEAGKRLPDMAGMTTLVEEQFNRLGPDEMKQRSSLAAEVEQAKSKYQVFHWWLEFAEVFFSNGELRKGGGFDVVLGNPPWERVKLQEKEFFAGRHDPIAEAENASKRKRLIEALKDEDPALYLEFQQALNASENFSSFLRTSGTYPLTGGGDVNTYQVFAELTRRLLGDQGHAGVIVPAGIATDDSNKEFFRSLVDARELTALFMFNNTVYFSQVGMNQKLFAILCIARSITQKPKFASGVSRDTDLNDLERLYYLSSEELWLLNPNTGTCPVFRTRTDAELTKKIYRRVPVLWKEEREAPNIPQGGLFPSEAPLAPGTKMLPEENPWGIKFMRLLDMSNDSSLFKSRGDLEKMGYQLQGNRMVLGESVYLPLYEAKLFHHFDHRFATYAGDDTRDMSLVEHSSPDTLPLPRYWVAQEEVEGRLSQRDRDGKEVWGWKRKWLLGFRDITNATNERTAIFSIMPRVGVGHKAPLVFPMIHSPAQTVGVLLANASSLVFDYCARQKVGGTDISYHRLKQFAVLPPNNYTPLAMKYVLPRVLELTYTAWDLAPFAQDVWQESDPEMQDLLRKQWQANRGHPDTPPTWVEGPYPFPPFRWDEERRAILRAELDAYYAKLYGLEREELAYILDPQSVKGEDFPSETFRVLKNKEIKAFGEYRTQRLVLEAWDRLWG